MLTDLNQSNPGSIGETQFDVVIAGGGPAGITLARKLAAAGKTVALLEGGDLQYSQQSHEVYTISEQSDDYTKMYFEATRLRYFGGTSNHWAGRCSPCRDLDFTDRPGIYSEPGWPLPLSEIEPYLDEARDILDIGEPDDFQFIGGTQPLPENFKPDIALFSPPTRFGAKYLDEVQNADNIHLYLNANLVDIKLNGSLQNTEFFAVKNYNGMQFEFRGKAYVLALGAIENARLLLASNSQLTAGIGNGGGMVGACYMDHYNVTIGEFSPESEVWDDTQRMAYYTTADFVVDHKIGSANASMSYGSPIKTYGKLPGLKKFLAERACSLGWEETLQKAYAFNCPSLGVITTMIEQDPDRNNRILLTDETDSLGLPRVKVEWTLSDFDKRTVRKLATELAVQLKEAGYARVKLPDFVLNEEADIPYYGHAHHLGTTRMSETEEHGVVDSNCKVFGNDNLYVAGSSIFPRGGANNPTMPLIQFALRLSDHLLKQSLNA